MKQNRHIALICTFIAAAALSTSAQEPARLHGFGPATPVAAYSAYSADSPQVILSGDVDGDHLDDLILFSRSTPGKDGDVEVMRNTGSTFAAPVLWHGSFCLDKEIPLIGDFNGDGRADIASFVRSNRTGAAEGDVYVGLSSGTTFVATRWHDYFCTGDQYPVVGDFNGDGLDDAASCTRGTTADVYVATSNGSSFTGSGLLWHSNFCPGTAIPIAGDFNGDGYDDLAAFLRSSVPGQEGDVRVTLSTAATFSSFSGNTLWHDFFCIGDEMPAVADVNADGKADILTYVRSATDVYTALSNGASFTGTGEKWHDSLPMLPHNGSFLAGHYNGDASADIMTLGSTSLAGEMGFAVVALCGAHAIPLPSTTAGDLTRLATDFGVGTLGLPAQNFPAATRLPREERYLLCVLLASPAKPPDRTAFSLTNASAAALCFGPGHPNLRSCFDEMSGGKFTFRPANLGGGTGVIGPLDVPLAADPWSYGIQAADPQFNFAPYDLNGDGYVDTNELVVLVFDNISEAGASNRFRTMAADGKNLRLHISAGGHRTGFQTAAHEVSHSLGTVDLYNGGCYGSGATLMSCTGGNTFLHLDAWHKMRLGWFTPRIYDVSEFPGGAWISAPQEAGTVFFKPPVMLYDPARATKEHYTLEFRNNTYDDGSDGWAGYDQHVAGRGLITWYTRTAPDNGPERDELYIDPGNNGVNNSVKIGDDILSGGYVLPGPNRILDSVPSGDDGYIGDNTCFVTLTPDTFSSRANVEVYNDPAQSLSLNWWTKPAPGGLPPANVPSGVSFRTVAFGGGGYVEWGKRFSPWLDQPLSTNLSAGGTYLFTGDLGVRDRGSDGTSYAVLRSPRTGVEVPLSTELSAGDQQWDGLHASWRVPLSTPPGRYNIQVYRSPARAMVSNAWPVSVRNPYYAYTELHFTSAEILSGNFVDPSADPDSDGLVNGLEFMLGSSPRDASDGSQLYIPSVKNGQFNMTWSGPVDAEGFFDLMPEISTDLSKWTALPKPDRSDNGVFAYYTSSVPATGTPRTYLRLRITCPAWK